MPSRKPVFPRSATTKQLIASSRTESSPTHPVYDGPVIGGPEDDAGKASIIRDRRAFRRIGDAGERVPVEQGRFQWVPVDDQDVPGLLPV